MNDLLLDVAIRELGSHEEGGNNCGPKIRQYQSATWLEPAAWPWCAAFVDWCIMRWLDNLVVRDWLKLSKEEAADFRPRTAGAWDLANWAKKYPQRVSILPESAQALPGDVIIFDFSHVGMVERDKGNTILTIEGNTNHAGDRDSNAGDGVWRKSRDRNLAKNFLRMHPPI